MIFYLNVLFWLTGTCKIYEKMLNSTTKSNLLPVEKNAISKQPFSSKIAQRTKLIYR